MQFLKLRFQNIIHLQTVPDLEIHVVSIGTGEFKKKQKASVPAVTDFPE